MTPKKEVIRFLALRHDDLKSMHMIEIVVPTDAPLKVELISEKLAVELEELHSDLPGSPRGFEVFRLGAPENWSVYIARHKASLGRHRRRRR